MRPVLQQVADLQDCLLTNKTIDRLYKTDDDMKFFLSLRALYILITRKATLNWVFLETNNNSLIYPLFVIN